MMRKWFWSYWLYLWIGLLLTGPLGCAYRSNSVKKITITPFCNQTTGQWNEWNDQITNWQEILTQYVSPQGRLDLKNLKQDTQANTKLNCFLTWVSKLDMQNPPTEFQDAKQQTAFYINLHNRASIHAILLYDSVHKSACPEDVCDNVLFPVAGQNLSLNEIADRCGIENDWRIDFALASPLIGGPSFDPNVYLADRLDDQLDRAVKRYIGSCAGMRFDYENKRILFGELIWKHRKFWIDHYERLYGIKNVSLISALIPWVDRRTQEQLVDHVGFKIAPLQWKARMITYSEDEEDEEKTKQKAEEFPCGIW